MTKNEFNKRINRIDPITLGNYRAARTALVGLLGVTAKDLQLTDADGQVNPLVLFLLYG